MKTKNQTEQDLLELAVTKAANDEAVMPRRADDSAAKRKQAQAWSPFEVWRTRVRAPILPDRSKPTQI